MTRFLNSNLTYNLPAIMKTAWLRARYAVVAAAKSIGPFKGRVIPLRDAFAAELRRTWGEAKSERSYAEWCIEQDVERARVAALPQRDRAIVAAERALLIAEHNDTAIGHRLVREARARLASLQHAA